LASRLRADLDRAASLVVSGVPVGSDDALLALAGQLGEPSAVGNYGLIHDVAPKPLEEQRDVSTTRDEFELHTDSTALLQPHDCVLLACQLASPDGGGESRILHVDTLRSALAERHGSDVVEALSQPVFPFPLNDPRHGTGFRRAPVLDWEEGRTRIRYRRDALAMGLAVEPIEPAHQRALDALEEVVGDARLQASCMLEPGDVLVLDNRRVLHGRTAIRPGAERLLRRLKVFRDGDPYASRETAGAAAEA
jgi:hypothetical protein